MMIFFNVFTIEGVAALYVIKISSLCKLAALICYFKVIGILSTPPTSVSTTKNILERQYVTRALRHVNITVNIEDLEHP